MMTTPYEVRPIGYVKSPLVDRKSAPKQGSEGVPDAWLVFDPGVAEGIRHLAAGADVFVLAWLYRARRDVCSPCTRATTRETLRRECSAPGPRTGRTRSGCTGYASPRSTDPACSCGILKPSTGRPSWTSSRYSLAGGERRPDR